MTPLSSSPLASVTLVCVVGDHPPDAPALERFAAALTGLVTDFDVILVVNGAVAEAALHLKSLIAVTPDATAVFLAEPVHDDMARLVGIEHAVGDYILFADPLRDDPGALPQLLAPLRQGYDLVAADRGEEGPPRPPVEQALVSAYQSVYRWIAKTPLDLQPTGLRVLSRAAALYLAGRPDAELRLRARTIGTGFPAIVVPMPPNPAQSNQQIRHSWSKGLGMLLSVSTMPLRGASYAAALGGGLSSLYSLYVFTVFLFQKNVAAGWTTLSLQLASMMFVFSIVLLFISEYVIQIHSASPPRSRRYLVVRELRSPLSRRTRRLNVVDGDGAFQLGKPAWLIAGETEGA